MLDKQFSNCLNLETLIIEIYKYESVNRIAIKAPSFQFGDFFCHNKFFHFSKSFRSRLNCAIYFFI